MSDEDPAREALANVLGALALVVTDELERVVTDAGGRVAVTDAVALAALRAFLDGATLDRLHQVLGVTPSGAVRLVDRLADADLVSREAGPDKRSRAVRLTDGGRRRADAVHAARADYLRALTAAFSPDEVATLRDLLGQVMAAVVGAKDGGAWTCRLCDLVACRRSEGECPTYTAALDRPPSA